MFKEFGSCGWMAVAVALATATMTQASDDAAIFHKRIADAELVVLRSPAMDVSAFGGLLSQAVTRNVSSAFLLSVELRRNQGAPVPIWSKVYPMAIGAHIDEYRALDFLVLPDRFVLVMSEASSMISVSEIRWLFGFPEKRIALKSSDWSLLGGTIVAPKDRLGASMTYNEQQKRLELEVTDLMQQTKQHTLFQQKPEQWEFVKVKQWRETVPAASSTTTEDR